MARFSLRHVRRTPLGAAILVFLGAAVLAAQATPSPAQAPKQSGPCRSSPPPSTGLAARGQDHRRRRHRRPGRSTPGTGAGCAYAAVSWKEKEDAAPIYGVGSGGRPHGG